MKDLHESNDPAELERLRAALAAQGIEARIDGPVLRVPSDFFHRAQTALVEILSAPAEIPDAEPRAAPSPQRRRVGMLAVLRTIGVPVLLIGSLLVNAILIHRLYLQELAPEQDVYDERGRLTWRVYHDVDHRSRLAYRADGFDVSGERIDSAFDRDRDGRWDEVQVFHHGRRVGVSRDADGDGIFEVQELERAGEVIATVRDEDGDGWAELSECTNASGTRERYDHARCRLLPD